MPKLASPAATVAVAVVETVVSTPLMSTLPAVKLAPLALALAAAVYPFLIPVVLAFPTSISAPTISAFTCLSTFVITPVTSAVAKFPLNPVALAFASA